MNEIKPIEPNTEVELIAHHIPGREMPGFSVIREGTRGIVTGRDFWHDGETYRVRVLLKQGEGEAGCHTGLYYSIPARKLRVLPMLPVLPKETS